MSESKVCRMVGKSLVDLYDAEGRPLVLHGSHRLRPRSQANRAHRLDKPDSAHEPPRGLGHRTGHDIAARFSHVPLDQSTRVEVEVQRSASRSASTSADALRRSGTGRGGRRG